MQMVCRVKIALFIQKSAENTTNTVNKIIVRCQRERTKRKEKKPPIFLAFSWLCLHDRCAIVFVYKSQEHKYRVHHNASASYKFIPRNSTHTNSLANEPTFMAAIIACQPKSPCIVRSSRTVSVYAALRHTHTHTHVRNKYFLHVRESRTHRHTNGAASTHKYDRANGRSEESRQFAYFPYIHMHNAHEHTRTALSAAMYILLDKMKLNGGMVVVLM